MKDVGCCSVMSPWLFNVRLYEWHGSRGECYCARERAGVAECKWWQFETNQLLFADDTALVADSEEKLCRLMSEFRRVCEKRKLRVNVGKSKVMRCSRYFNGSRMHVILNGEPLEGVDCFKYLASGN